MGIQFVGEWVLETFMFELGLHHIQWSQVGPLWLKITSHVNNNNKTTYAIYVLYMRYVLWIKNKRTFVCVAGSLTVWNGTRRCVWFLPISVLHLFISVRDYAMFMTVLHSYEFTIWQYFLCIRVSVLHLCKRLRQQGTVSIFSYLPYCCRGILHQMSCEDEAG